MFAQTIVVAQSVSDSIGLQEVVITEKYSDREMRATAPIAF